MSKVCTKCNEDKPLSEYHKKGDRYRAQCKDCRKLENPANRLRSSRYYRENKEKILAEREGNKDWVKHTKYTTEWRKKNPLKARAHWAVSNALRAGKLVKSPCKDCGSEEVHAHHDDYTKPLDVIWVCDTHHKLIHGRLINA